MNFNPDRKIRDNMKILETSMFCLSDNITHHRWKIKKQSTDISNSLYAL